MPREVQPTEVSGHLKTGAPRWYEALPAASAEIDCDGERHHITWRHGKLVLEDHDVLAEQSLAALGGEPPVCLQVLHAWRAVRDSELLYELLLRESTHSPELLAVMRATHESRMARAQRPQRMRASVRTPTRQADTLNRLEPQAATQVERQQRRWATTLIKALPTALRRALALSVIVRLERHWDDEEFRREHAKHIEPALGAIATPLFEHSARRWKRSLKPYARISAEASLIAPGESPRCTARADRTGAHAALALPLSWFTDVWARGIALVDHCFVIGLAQHLEDGRRLRVVAVRWERENRETSRSVEAPAVVTRGRRGDWRLHWV